MSQYKCWQVQVIKMLDNLVIRAYAELKVKMEVTAFMEEVYLDEKDYISTYIDKEKGLELDAKIKATHQYFLKLKKAWKKLYDLIDEVCYNTLTDSEKIVFHEFFMNNKSAEEIKNQYKDMNFTLNGIYNTTHKINQQLKRIKIKTWISESEAQ